MLKISSLCFILRTYAQILCFFFYRFPGVLTQLKFINCQLILPAWYRLWLYEEGQPGQDDEHGGGEEGLEDVISNLGY